MKSMEFFWELILLTIILHATAYHHMTKRLRNKISTSTFLNKLSKYKMPKHVAHIFDGRCILKKIGGEVVDLLVPILMGFGLSGGSEIAARMSQVFLDAHPGHVLIKTDFKNAFNLFPCRLMLEGVQTFYPRLLIS
jgi:hypothetical protein